MTDESNSTVAEIEIFEQELREFLKSETSQESLFQMGVKLGRLLERTGGTYFRPKAFAERDNNAKRIWKALEVVHSVLLSLTKFATEAAIEKNGLHVFHAHGYPVDGRYPVLNGSYFSDDIVDRYFIQYSSIEADDPSISFRVYFDIVGKLGEIFERHKLPTTFYAILANRFGNPIIELESKSDLDAFEGCELDTRDAIDADAIEALARDIGKYKTWAALR